jgi:DNA polymerase (family 10)
MAETPAADPLDRTENAAVAADLEHMAELLAAQHAGSFRVRAYRTAAHTVRESPVSMRVIDRLEGLEGLERLPGIGPSIASVIHERLHTGRIASLARLRGAVSPEDLFTTVPGIGEELARRIHDELDVETLEELEMAAHDGRLARIPGFGPRRLQALRDSLAGILARSARRRARAFHLLRGSQLERPERPRVETLLAVDAEYRRRAGAGDLRLIAPRRFNPGGDAWLPIMHTERDGWHFTALYSNTARAHRLGMTRDWVILYWERDGHEDQCTVVTERRGVNAGRRVVRGREAETPSDTA